MNVRRAVDRTRAAGSHGTCFKGAAVVVVLVAAWVLVLLPAARATPAVSGSASSSVAPCLQVGSSYLSTPNPNIYEQDVYLYWTGTITSARLVGYQFNAGGTYGRLIKINGTKIGNAAEDFDNDPQCRGFENGQAPQSWHITGPGNPRSRAATPSASRWTPRSPTRAGASAGRRSR